MNVFLLAKTFNFLSPVLINGLSSLSLDLNLITGIRVDHTHTYTHTHTYIYIYIYILCSVYLGNKLLLRQILLKTMEYCLLFLIVIFSKYPQFLPQLYSQVSSKNYFLPVPQKSHSMILPATYIYIYKLIVFRWGRP